MSNEEKKEEGTPAFLVYTGQREGRTNGYLYSYMLFHDISINTEKSDETGLKKLAFDKALFKTSAIGAIYKITDKGETIAYNGKDIPIDFWRNNEARAKWQAFETAINSEKTLKKKTHENMLIERLKPLNQVYRSLGTQQKRHFLAEVFRIITN